MLLLSESEMHFWNFVDSKQHYAEITKSNIGHLMSAHKHGIKFYYIDIIL